MIRSLKKIVSRLDKLDLPVTVESFHGYGSTLRGKENPGDLDLILVYSMTEEQMLRWKRFSESFKDFIHERQRNPNIQMDKMSFPDFVSQEFDNGALKKEIVLSWAKTFSKANTWWYSRFNPNFGEVTKKILLKDIKRVQILHFEKIRDFKSFDGRDKRYLLWSPKSPDININFKKVSIPEICRDKIDEFINDLEKEKKELLDVQSEIIQKAKKVGIHLSFEKLNSLHPSINYHRKKYGPSKLQELTELTRTETKKCETEKRVLNFINQMLQVEYPFENEEKGSKEEKITLKIFKKHQETYLKEKDLRQVLRVLELPEDHVITMRQCGKYNDKCWTTYILESESLKREKIITKSKIEKKRTEYIKAIRPKIRKIDKNLGVYVEMNRIRPQEVEIYFRGHTKNKLPFFRNRGFTVNEYENGGFFAEVSIPLHGSETKKEIIEKVMSRCS